TVRQCERCTCQKTTRDVYEAAGRQLTAERLPNHTSNTHVCRRVCHTANGGVRRVLALCTRLTSGGQRAGHVLLAENEKYMKPQMRSPTLQTADLHDRWMEHLNVCPVSCKN
ncbi:hypothetical protein KUCAC02_037368, partial [Chaenocephalus aceratus]